MNDLFSPSVNPDLTFRDLFRKEMSPSTRRDRWESWKKAADKEVVAFWEDASACEGCDQLDGDWCRLQGLPGSVNPILSFRFGYIGMACMGIYERPSNDGGPDE